jgi:membrane protein implicated in regulation of membrane protease activity
MTTSDDSHGGVNKPTPTAWASVILMIVGFTLCTLAFIIGNTLMLWIPGIAIGFVGVVLAFTSKLLEHAH